VNISGRVALVSGRASGFALAGRRPAAPAAELSEDDILGLKSDRRSTLDRLLFPGPAAECRAHHEQFGDVAVLPTTEFLYGLRPGVEHAVDLEPGVRLLIGVEAISEPDERGLRTVVCTLNGQLRPVTVRDRSVDARVAVAEKADRDDPGQVAAPFSGVVTLAVTAGKAVEAGQAVATIEAMKMAASTTTPVAGTVRRVAVGPIQQVEGGDLLLVVEALR
jgi:pyruvate carboxylase